MMTSVVPVRVARAAAVSVLVLATSAGHTGAASAALPEIRMSERNRVPACATPERLMGFLRARNGGLDSRYADIARHYKTHGEAWRVRWDYAFFQMLVETNFLTWRAPGGRLGDVHPRQNNFAGIGTTGGGVPGDSFPSVSVGVLAQIQHLVAYSGERLANPTAPRTRLKMDEILTKSAALGRPVNFQDLSGRWAVDRAYGRSIEWAAQSFRSGFCQGQPVAEDRSGRQRFAANAPPMQSRLGSRRDRDEDDDEDDRPARRQTDLKAGPRKPLTRPLVTGSLQKTESPAKVAAKGPLPAAPAPALKVQPSPPAIPLATPATAAPGATGSTNARPVTCKIFRASYGGPKTVLIESQKDALTNYTVLEVIAGKEQEQAKAFMAAHAQGGKIIGEFATEPEALKKSFELCPGG